MQGVHLVWGRNGPWACHSFSERMPVKDPEPVLLLQVPWEGCGVDVSPVPPGLKQGWAHGALSLLMGAGVFPGSPIQPPSAAGALPSTIPPSNFQPFLILWHPSGGSSRGVEPTCRAVFDPQFAFLVQDSWVAEK